MLSRFLKINRRLKHHIINYIIPVFLIKWYEKMTIHVHDYAVVEEKAAVLES